MDKLNVDRVLGVGEGGVGRGVSGGLSATAGDMKASGASPHRRNKITFARLATCVLNVEKARKKSCRGRSEDYLHAAETGDVQRLRTLVRTIGVNQLECTDQLGRTPIHLAVINEHKDTVKFLLDHVDKRRAYQALLYAINLGNEEIAELIIEHSSYSEISAEIRAHQGRGGTFFDQQNKFVDDNQFSEEITPLILASQQNRFEVVMALLLKNEKIDRPHKCHCPCSDCLMQAERDELKFARSRLNAYRALASEAYISLSSDDPILTSFRLRKELQLVAKQEKYYTAEYSVLASKLSEYVVKLLDKVHGNEELNAILNAPHDDDDGDDYDDDDDDGDDPDTNGAASLAAGGQARESGELREGKGRERGDTLMRLELAIECKEKKFVAHPSCQKKLTTLWYKDLNKLLRKRSTLVQTAVIGLIILIYPVLSFVYILAPYSPVGNLLKTPCVKFVAHAVSYLFFLCLIVVHGHVEQAKLCSVTAGSYRGLNESFQYYQSSLSYDYHNFPKMCLRNSTPAAMEVCILLWISGMVWQACKQVCRAGGRSYFINIYNAMDFFMLQCYMASFALRRITERMVRKSLGYFSLDASWRRLIAKDKEASYYYYWLNADRYYWDAWDPMNVCEAMFAIGNILNFARLFHLLAINEHLGPMLISLERMIKDVMKFMVTFVPIFLGFMVGMYNLYWYYDPGVRKVVEVESHNIKTRAEEGFGSLEYTFRTIFWALFGLKEARTVELGDQLIRARGEQPAKQFNGRFTESVGYIVFGVYNWGAVIVLLNMLIAMMTRSFDKIATDQDIEWKFVRSKVYMEYIHKGSTLPIPFNVIPTPKSLARLVSWLLSFCRRTRGKNLGGRRSLDGSERGRRARSGLEQADSGTATRSTWKDLRETSPIFTTNGKNITQKHGRVSMAMAESKKSAASRRRVSDPPPASRHARSSSPPTTTGILGGKKKRSRTEKWRPSSANINACEVGESGAISNSVTITTDLDSADNQQQSDVTSRSQAEGAGEDLRRPLGRRLFAPQSSLSTDLADPPINDERSVIKAVVRRYIFERLLASVVPNEGSNELENIKSLTVAVQEDLRCIKPKIFEQFAMVTKEFIHLHKTIGDVRDLLCGIAAQTHRQKETEGDGSYTAGVFVPQRPVRSSDSSMGGFCRPNSGTSLDDIEYSLRCSYQRDRTESGQDGCPALFVDQSELVFHTDREGDESVGRTDEASWLRRLRSQDSDSNADGKRKGRGGGVAKERRPGIVVEPDLKAPDFLFTF